MYPAPVVGQVLVLANGVALFHTQSLLGTWGTWLPMNPYTVSSRNIPPPSPSNSRWVMNFVVLILLMSLINCID